MTQACIVPFFKYEPAQRGNYKILFKYFVKHLAIWAKTIDHLYLIDSGCGLDVEDQKILDGLVKNTVYHIGSNSHWSNLNNHIPLIQESKFMLIDSDTIISDSNVVSDIFEKLDEYDIVSMTDGSGGVDLFQTYPVFAANEFRDHRRRFAPYLFAARTQFFKNIGAFDFTPAPPGPNWTDSMGTISQQLLAQNPKFYELPDDRTSIYYIDGEHKTAAFLDNNNFKWSQTIPNDYGYYHVRNFNGGLYLVESRALNPKAYQHAKSIMPRQEAMRLLGWLWVMADTAYRAEIVAVVQDFGVSETDFNAYLKAFTEFHKWINKI